MLLVFISICIIIIVTNIYYFIKKNDLENYVIPIYLVLLFVLFILVYYFDYTINIISSVINTIALLCILLFPILIS